MEQHHRGQWGSNLGFLMATVGAAVGLGNIWSFPFRMGKNGGFPFLIIYLVLAILVGFTIMLCELAIGRKGGGSVLDSYRKVGGKMGGFLGFFALLSPFLILSFYTVLGAYCIQYVGLNFAELLGIFSLSSVSGADSFGAMLTNQPLAIGTTFLFIALCFLIIRGGIKEGIERFNKVGMPALFVMLVIVIIRSLTLPGAIEGLKFMFAPNFEPIQTNFISVLSAAGGQMFFSLSLAMGITVTYGSYLSKKESLVKNSLVIIVSDTLVAVMAGLAVLPAAFALGGGEDAALSGPKLLFITLQDVFNSMGAFGPIFGILFFLFVVLAAITSAIALTEVLVTFIIDARIAKGKAPKRNTVVALVCLVIFIEAAVVAADGLGSNGMWVPFQSTGLDLGSCWLEFMDFVSEGIAMPLGALIMSILIGWVIGPKAIRDEVSLEGHTMSDGVYTFFVICVRFVAPIAMAFILFGQNKNWPA